MLLDELDYRETQGCSKCVARAAEADRSMRQERIGRRESDEPNGVVGEVEQTGPGQHAALVPARVRARPGHRRPDG